MKYNIFLLLVFYYPIILFSQQNQSIGNKGVKDGFGVLEYKGHGVYRGNFVNSKIEGYGEYFFNNGDVIKGNKKNGLYEGVVTYYFSNGDVKTANYTEGKEVSVISYSNASEKKGGCVSGDCQNGRGKYIYTNGEYEGSFLYGNQTGQGKLTLPNGDSYEGQFSNGIKNGYGILLKGNGEKYEGNYKNGQKSGIGTFYYLDGGKYIGNWTDGNKNGRGEFYFSDGSYYVGEFVNGSRTGNGKVVLADGKIQEGLFENDIYKGVSTSNTVTQNTIVSPPPVDKNQVSVVKTQVDPRFTTNLKSVVIGTQTWTTENLNVSTFRNGDPILEVKTEEDWKIAGENNQPAWCYFENDPSNGTKYGKLYNWHAVNDPRGLAPKGWHVPTREEWTVIKNYMGSDYQISIKSSPKMETKVRYVEEGGYDEKKWVSCIKCNYWTEVQKKYNYCSACRNNGGTTVKTGKYIPKTKKKVVETFNVGWDGNDRFGFHAIPGGIRSVDSDNEGFVHNGKGCYFWSTTIDRDKWAEMTYVMSNDKSYWTVSVSRRESGLSVRCIKD